MATWKGREAEGGRGRAGSAYAALGKNMSRGPLHYDKQAVHMGHTKYCLKSCVPEREWSRQKPSLTIL